MAGDTNHGSLGNGTTAAGEISSTPRQDENTPLLSGQPKSTGDQSGEGGSQQPGESEETITVTELSTTRIVIILTTTYLGTFLGAIDSSIIATLSGPISSEFKSLGLLSWLATAYLIANAACQPLSGRLTDIFGRGPGLVFSNVLFAIGNLICGLAQDEYVMIVGRVVAGIGGGGLMSISTFLASDLIPLRNRGVVQGIGNVAYAAGSMLGGVLGGWFNDHTAMGWRLAFLVQVPPVVLSAILVYFLVNVPPKISERSFLARIDYGGAALTVSSLVLLLLGLNAGGNIVPWTHPLVLTTLPLSLVSIIAFVWWENRVGQPIIPVKLLLHRTILAACLTNFVTTMAIYSTLFYVPLYMQVLGHTATEAGLTVLGSPLGISFCSIGAGYIMQKTGRYLALGIVDLVVFLGGSILLTTLNESTPYWIPFIIFVIFGGTYGAMLTLTLIACISAVDHSYQAVITSATYAFRSVGATVGITIASAVYQNVLKAELWERFGSLPGAAEEIERIRGDLGEISRLPDGWKEGVIQSFMAAFRSVWLTSVGLVVIGLICVSLMKEHKLHSKLDRREEEGEEE